MKALAFTLVVILALLIVPSLPFFELPSFELPFFKLPSFKLPVLQAPFSKGDLVTPKKDVVLSWAPPGVNDTLGTDDSDPPIFRKETIGVIRKGGSLNAFVWRDPLFFWRWWCRVDIGPFAQWCQCDNLELVNSQE